MVAISASRSSFAMARYQRALRGNPSSLKARRVRESLRRKKCARKQRMLCSEKKRLLKRKLKSSDKKNKSSLIYKFHIVLSAGIITVAAIAGAPLLLVAFL